MAKEFNVKISTPTKICIDKQAINVTMPTSKGYIGILPEHAKIVGAINPGYIYITYANGQKLTALINYGVFYFKENHLVILSDFFEKSDKVNANAFDAIREIIDRESKKVQISENAVHALNSYMKMVSAKAKEK